MSSLCQFSVVNSVSITLTFGTQRLLQRSTEESHEEENELMDIIKSIIVWFIGICYVLVTFPLTFIVWLLAYPFDKEKNNYPLVPDVPESDFIVLNTYLDNPY